LTALRHVFSSSDLRRCLVNTCTLKSPKANNKLIANWSKHTAPPEPPPTPPKWLSHQSLLSTRSINASTLLSCELWAVSQVQCGGCRDRELDNYLASEKFWADISRNWLAGRSSCGCCRRGKKILSQCVRRFAKSMSLPLSLSLQISFDRWLAKGGVGHKRRQRPRPHSHEDSKLPNPYGWRGAGTLIETLDSTL